MSLTSLTFISFVIITIILFYTLPKKCQWVVLLVGSLSFYAYGNYKSLIFVLISSFTVFITAKKIQKIQDNQKKFFSENKKILSKEDKKLYKRNNKKKKRKFLILAICINLVILSFFKFAPALFNLLPDNFVEINDAIKILIPLGISYYTLQIIGYMVDVYSGSVTAENNYFKVLLFTSFFPQMTQGPISDYSQLSHELFKEHFLQYKNFAFGIYRIFWGFFKKLVVANILYTYMTDIFDHYNEYNGIILIFGLFICMIQLYADFSGYMDIVCGICEICDIKLSENFNCPFFSKSLSEFWRRWHITLGAWFKKYVFYAVGMSKWNNNLAKKARKKFGNTVADNLPTTIAMFVIWFLIGAWHGTSWAFIIWGLLNGVIMIISQWLDPVYKKVNRIINVDKKPQIWQLFQILRTFLLVCILEIISDVGSVSDGFIYLKNIFTNFSIPNTISEVTPFVSQPIYVPFVIVGLILIFIISVIKQRYNVRELIYKAPIVFRITSLVILFFVTTSIGIPLLQYMDGGFLYAQF